MKLDGLHVLLVEDEIIIGFDLESMVMEQGASTRLASSLQDAEEAVTQERFDAAILDVNLHGLQSYPVADRLSDQGCPFIFATGYGSTTHPKRHKTVPTVGKPYHVAAMLDALAKAMEAEV